jgi:predicted ATPase
VIKKVIIENFKCIEKEELEFRNLTILTGENSSGKSSVIQAILLAGNHPNLVATPFNSDLRQYLLSLGDTNSLVNKYQNAKEYHIKVKMDNFDPIELKVSKVDSNAINLRTEQFRFPNPLTYPDNLTYLNADRDRIRNINTLIKELKNFRYFQIDGKLTAGYFYLNKTNRIEDYLIKDRSEYTLEAQVNFWLKEITGIENIELKTEEITPAQVKASYDIDGLTFTPENVGIGISYLISILVACLSAKKGNIIIIENPEIHLHPKSQAKLGEFFAFIASKGIQVVIETHCEHLINKVRHEVYKGKLNNNDVVFHYFHLNNKRESLFLNHTGHFLNEKKEFTSFPKDFFDATLDELLEMG